MVYLASHHAEKYPVRKEEVAKAEDITSDYVQQILLKLKTAGLVLSKRGARGGFLLGRSPAKVTAYDVMVAVEGPLSLAPCQGGQCGRSGFCGTRGLWENAAESFRESLAGTTIQDLARASDSMASSRSLAFEI